MIYREAGVDLEAAERHVQRIGSAVTATWGANTIGLFGGFAAGIRLPPGYRDPVLMMSTDGVGTKIEIARRCQMWEGIGQDLVAMCVDDLAAVGARPLALVDYLAVGRLQPDRDEEIVTSIASACSMVGCALLGGETAEHPGVMDSNQVDLAGTAIGVVENGEQWGAHKVAPGDLIIGWDSPNLRCNGFSLVRKIVEGRDLEATFPGEDQSLGEVLLRPSIVYAQRTPYTATGVKAAAHITGGGLPGNLTRILPESCRAILDRRSWEVPAVFSVLGGWGDVSEDEMYRTFNMGIGFCLVVEPGWQGDGRVIGRVEEGVRAVEF